MIPRLRPCYKYIEVATALFMQKDNSVKRYEKCFAERFGQRFAVAFPYGRSAFHTLLCSLGFHDAEVVLPAYTCIVVPHAVLLSNNRPRFVDCESNHFNVSARKLEERLTPDTKVVIPTPIFGFPVDRKGYASVIKRISPEALVIYDCAQAFGVQDDGGFQYRDADAVIFSTGIGKQMTSLYGGMLLTNREDIYRTVRQYRDKEYRERGYWESLSLLIYAIAIKISFERWMVRWIDYAEKNTNLLYRYTDYYYGKDTVGFPVDSKIAMGAYQAEVGLRQLKMYERTVHRRQKIAKIYDHILSNSGVSIFRAESGATYSHYPVLVADKDVVTEGMRSKKIQVGELIDYSCPEMPMYAPYCDMDFPNSRYFSKHILNLPNWFGITDEEVQYVGKAVTMSDALMIN